MLFKRFRIIKTTRPAPAWVNTLSWFISGLVLFGLALIVIFEGYRLSISPFVPVLIRWLIFIAGIGTVAEIALKRVVQPVLVVSKPKRIFDTIIAALIVITLIIRRFTFPLLLVYQAVSLSSRLSRAGFSARFFGNLRQRPVRTLALSFLILIVAGTILLTFPAATVDGRGADLLTALFTATSATCVTGLIVKDTGTYFSRFGQMVILALIQLGGLGIMTFYTSLIVVLGQRLGLTERKTMADLIEETREVDIARLVRYIFLFTFLAEALGVLVLFLRWLFVLPSPGQALYFAIFHSVSAFCNAGFSLFSDSFVRFQSDVITNLSIIGLIVLGGLGFPVVNELFNRYTIFQTPRKTLRRLSIHARLVLWATSLLIGVGTIVFFFLEYDNALNNLSIGTRLLSSLFQAVTARTAGFNTVAINLLRPVTLFLWAILMFIGASPGGTGGGIKTTTIAVILLAVRSRLRGEEEITFGNRFIPKEVVYRATAIVALSLAVCAACFTLLLVTQSQRFEWLLFETVSAFGTVGLSCGITPNLNYIGKLSIIILMFVGRIGPLTLTLAMAAPRERSLVAYPSARVIVG
ncbi:MAG: TrkH family potassium uptake protein [candidate division WOR-3 bacterium]